MSFKITPIDVPPEKKGVSRRTTAQQVRGGGKALTEMEIWEYGWMMWKMGKLIRFRIKGMTDMRTPILPPHEYTGVRILKGRNR